jgi:hypothetical protein
MDTALDTCKRRLIFAHARASWSSSLSKANSARKSSIRRLRLKQPSINMQKSGDLKAAQSERQFILVIGQNFPE